MMRTCCDPVTAFKYVIEELKNNVSDAWHVLVIRCWQLTIALICQLLNTGDGSADSTSG